jgi:uncharacterized protein
VKPGKPARFRSQAVTGAISCLLLLLAARLVSGADLTQLEPRGYVNDFANVLDAGARTQIERYCADVERATRAQIAVVTIDTTGGTPIEDFANTLFRRWGVGQKESNEGVMLLLAVNDRRWRIEVGYGLEPILPDAFVDDVGREMRPSLRQNDFATAISAATAEIGARIAEAKGVTITRTLPRRGPPTAEDEGFPWPVIVFLILLMLGLFGRRGGGGFLTGMILGSLLGGPRYRGGGGWGGGGFGGYDGGGGFGGFGGGDSGGGGASGSW